MTKEEAVVAAARDVQRAVTRKPDDWPDMEGLLWDEAGERAVEALLTVLAALDQSQGTINETECWPECFARQYR